MAPIRRMPRNAVIDEGGFDTGVPTPVETKPAAPKTNTDPTFNDLTDTLPSDPRQQAAQQLRESRAAAAERAQSGLPEGFTAGQLPTELQQFFGAEPDTIGYRINRNSDGTVNVEVAKAGGGTRGYGATVRQNQDGSYSVVPPTGGGGMGGGGASASASTAMSPEDVALQRARVSAKASLEAWLKTFFDATRDADTIKSLMSFVDQQVTSDIPEDAIMINIREQKFYKDRFKGNEGLRAAGMAELDPAQYLQAEQNYADILNAANLNNLARRDIFSSLIGGQVSALELQDRVTNVYDRIRNADTALREEMRRLNQLGNITAADFAESLLTGKEGAANLKRKIAQAEISTEFTVRGLESTMGIQELERLGVSRQQAREGAEYARMGTQRLTDLATIYGVQQANIQKELEAEAFTGLESQRRKQLTAQERAAFAGSAGTGTTSLGGSTAGAI